MKISDLMESKADAEKTQIITDLLTVIKNHDDTDGLKYAIRQFHHCKPQWSESEVIKKSLIQLAIDYLTEYLGYDVRGDMDDSAKTMFDFLAENGYEIVIRKKK